MPPDWDVEADVVVVGFGAAGACAALEAAAAGAAVLVLDRFGGGGATALSGGVVYAGGGTAQQRAAGVTDSPEAMFGYLSLEVGDAVRAAHAAGVLRGQRGHAGLAGESRRAVRGQPVPGQDVLPDEPALPVLLRQRAVRPRDVAPPAPRGHRARGRGTSGGLLFARLAAAVRAPAPGCSPRPPRGGWSPTRRPGDRGGVPDPARLARLGRLAHRVLHRWSAKPHLYVPKLGRVLHRPVGWLERRYGRPLRVGARARRGAGRRRIRGQPGDDARARPRPPRRPAAGHPGRRRQRHPARHRGRWGDPVPGPGLGLAVPQPAGRAAARRAGRPGRASGCATSRATARRSARR